MINVSIMSAPRDFYLRYYVGHKGKFGHEFLEFEFRPDGNNSVVLGTCSLSVQCQNRMCKYYL